MATVWYNGGQRVLALVLLMCFLWCASGKHADSKRRLELVMGHPKRLNKPPVKSIKSPDGDIIDCVHISKQPAFDHPLLKNHAIKKKPSSYPDEHLGASEVASIPKGNTNTISQLWHSTGSCPKDTIPIRRTTEADFLRASSAKRYERGQMTRDPQPHSEGPVIGNGHEYAIAYVKGGKYYGTKAMINVWKPRIQVPEFEMSLAQFWIGAGSFGVDLNSLEAGWQVSPSLYGDDNTRLFIYWTRDSYNSTGCYNLLCSGFVQINNKIAFGGAITPISEYNNSSQREIIILVWKDPEEGHWWIQFGSDILGYWPSSLFSLLADSADSIGWGGEVVNSQPEGMHTSTEMGSGHFPGEGFGKASFFRNLQIVDGSNALTSASKIGELKTYTLQSNCYDLQISGGSSDWGDYFYYGGPGKNPRCP